MSSEATSNLTFGDLVLEIARKQGTAWYGEDGTEAVQAPRDDHDLAEAKRHANNALRMLIADAPPTGWRWQRPVATAYIWPDVSVDAAVTVTGGTYDAINDQTLLTCNSSVFYETMEEKDIVVTGQGTFTIKQYVSATTVYVYGSHYFATPATFSISTSFGDYTLPRDFAGVFNGDISWIAQTNRMIRLEFTHELTIRRMRENVNVNTGIPFHAAIAPFQPTNSKRRRWKLMFYPAPYQLFGIQIPYEIYPDEMTSLTEFPPTPITFDEALRAACLAVVERDVEDGDGPAMAYYQKCLANCYNLDARSGPRKLGYFGNAPQATSTNFRDWMKRPNVQFNP